VPRIVTNAAPMATCFMMSILESADRLKRFRREALDMLLPYDNRDKSNLRFDVSALKASPFIQGIWKEALRLYSASAAARVVTKDTEIEGYVVRKGSVILLPVQLMHFNPDAFPNPDKFDPERWIFDANDESHTRQQRKQAASLRSFGGGTGLCSGRFVAEQEIISTVATMLILFDVEIESPSELQLNPRSIGIMSPARTVRASLRRREISE
jgi:cytochrome P450